MNILFRYQDANQDLNKKAKVEINLGGVKVSEAEQGRYAATISKPVMHYIDVLPDFPITVKVKVSSEDAGHMMLSPIELNIGKKKRLTNKTNKLSIIFSLIF